MTSNYSFYSIPAYWVLALAPHLYAVSSVQKANNGYWDNANSRGTEWVGTMQKSLPKETLATFERAEAAHKNGMESAPLFIGAVLAGNMAGLGASTLNFGLGAYLGLRILYIALYVKTTRGKASYLRTLAWFAQTGILFTLFIKAGNKLVGRI